MVGKIDCILNGIDFNKIGQYTSNVEIKRKEKREMKRKNSLIAAYKKCKEKSVFIVFYIILCVSYTYMYECARLCKKQQRQKAENEEKEKNTQLNDVYLKLNLPSEFMRTNQHICASTHSPLIMSVSRSFHPQCSIYCSIEDEHNDTEEYNDCRRSICTCTCTNSTNERETNRRSSYTSATSMAYAALFSWC